MFGPSSSPCSVDLSSSCAFANSLVRILGIASLCSSVFVIPTPTERAVDDPRGVGDSEMGDIFQRRGRERGCSGCDKGTTPHSLKIHV